MAIFAKQEMKFVEGMSSEELRMKLMELNNEYRLSRENLEFENMEIIINEIKMVKRELENRIGKEQILDQE